MVGITHSTVVGVADDGISPVGTDEWNAEHVVPTDVMRAKLLATTDYYVTTSGNDTTGIGTVGSPFATPQGAWNYIKSRVDPAGQVIVVNIGDGTYPGVYLSEGVHSTVVYFKGNTSNPALVVIDDEPAVLTLGNVIPSVWFGDLTLAGAQVMQLEGQAFIRFGFGKIVLAPKLSTVANVRVWDQCFLMDRSSNLKIDYTIYPGAGTQRGFLDIDFNGSVVIGNSVNNTLEGTVSWTDAFAKVIGNGRLYNNRAWGGTHTVTGKRFIISSGHIQVYGLGLSVLPGDTDGTIENDGRYVN